MSVGQGLSVEPDQVQGWQRTAGELDQSTRSAIHAATAFRVWSVISKHTERQVLRCRTVARVAMACPWLTSCTRSATRSQALSFESMAKLKRASSRGLPRSCSLTRMAQMSRSLRGALRPTILPLFQGVKLSFVPLHVELLRGELDHAPTDLPGGVATACFGGANVRFRRRGRGLERLIGRRSAMAAWRYLPGSAQFFSYTGLAGRMCQLSHPALEVANMRDRTMVPLDSPKRCWRSSNLGLI